MKLLVIGNGAIEKNDNGYSINKHTASFVEELIESNVNVSFLQFEEVKEKNSGLQDCIVSKCISMHTVPIDKTKGLLSKISSYLKIIILMVKQIAKSDFIYIFYPGHVPLLASLICVLFRKNYGLYVRGQNNLDNSSGVFIIKRAEFCLTVSDLIKTQLLENNHDCETIAPMIDFSEKNILSERNYYFEGKIHCLFVGRVELRKGVYELADAIDALNKKDNIFHFDIVGGGVGFKELSERFNKVHNVKLLGQVSDKTKLLDLYRKADLFIFPSHDEGFPRVLYEAMMARVPVITTMVGGIGGFMKHNQNCIAIKANDFNSIIEAVNILINSEKLKIKLVNQATEDVLQLFNGTKEKHSKLLVRKLESLI
jgi:glycosyltransferase involved in cell wall biosynthesis